MLSLLADQTLIEQAALLKVLVYMLCCISKRKYIKNLINFKVGVGGGLGLFFSVLFVVANISPAVRFIAPLLQTKNGGDYDHQQGLPDVARRMVLPVIQSLAQT